jgi:hypothetical protein
MREKDAHVQTIPANAMNPELHAPAKPPLSKQAQTKGLDLQSLSVGLGKTHSMIRLSGIIILSSGAIVAFFCTVWAVEVGVPFPLGPDRELLNRLGRVLVGDSVARGVCVTYFRD